MGLRKNRRAVSSEVLKIAAAMLLAMAIFAMLVSFAFGPKEAEEEASRIGRTLLSHAQNASAELIAYNET